MRAHPSLLVSNRQSLPSDVMAELHENDSTLYGALRSIARRRLRSAYDESSLSTTGLVHEAYLRLAGSQALAPSSREHLLALASRVMNSVLVERFRARHAQKREGAKAHVDLDEVPDTTVASDDVLVIVDALERLARIDVRQAKLVEWHYLQCFTIEECAALSRISPATVKRDLRLARAWLTALLRNDR